METASQGGTPPERHMLAVRLQRVYARERVRELLRAVAADALGTRGSTMLAPGDRAALEAALDESTARVGEVVVAALADELAIAAHRLAPGLLQTILQRQAHEELGHE